MDKVINKGYVIKDSWAKSIDDVLAHMQEQFSIGNDGEISSHWYVQDKLIPKLLGSPSVKTYLHDNVDGIYELVNKYVPKKVDDFCTALLFYDLIKFAKVRKDEIMTTATNNLDNLINKRKDATNKVENCRTELSAIDEYNELSRTLKDVSHNKEIKAIIQAKLSIMERPLKACMAEEEKVFNQIINSCTFDEPLISDYDRVQQFINVEYPKIRARYFGHPVK